MEELLKEIKTYAKDNFIPIVRDKTIEKVVEILKNEDFREVLEIGTAIGYSGIMMLSGKHDARLTTIEKDPVRFAMAEKNFSLFSLAGRADCILGDAEEKLNALILAGKKFDFIFLDGPKGQYIRYYPLLKQLLRGGGMLFADNIFLGGLVKNEKEVTHKNRSMVNNMKIFLSKIENDVDFDSQEYDIDDGFLISRLKNSTE